MRRVQDKTVRNARMNKIERKKHWKLVRKTFFFMFLSLVIVTGLWFRNWVLEVLADTRDLDVDLIVSVNRTQLLDRHGNIYHETGTTREWVHLHEISPVMIDALLAIEDARFFEHEGVDWTRTLGAQVFNVETFIRGTGGLQGGSTLTQQLINQTHLLNTETGLRDTTIERKLQEMLLSFQIERILSKDQIIEAYLNYSPFGGGIYGIQVASEFYFGVDASELTLSQAAALAGIVQAPNDWRPDWNPHWAEQRRNEVLEMMYRHGYINETLWTLAAAEPISDMLVYYVSADVEENVIFQDYINHVLNEAYEVWGINAHGGYQIETHLDPHIQTTLVNTMITNDYGVFWPNEHIQSAAAVIETQTGIIRGLSGRNLQHTDYVQNRERGFVMATDITRAIGSTSKPIWAYGPAMEHLNWGAGTMLDDDVFAFQDGMLVRNWSNQHEGRVTIRQAMAPSWNPPALQAFNAVMAQDSDLVADFVMGLGIPENQVGFYPQGSTRDSYGTILESYAIGGNDTGMAPLHLAAAYAAFGNRGVYNQPRAILRIIAPDGSIYYEPSQVPIDANDLDAQPAEPFRQERIMSEATAYMMTDVLRTTVTNDWSRGPLYFSTATDASIADWFVVAKTGTTDFGGAHAIHSNIPWNAVPDVWIAGYTNEFTMAVWVGYESIEHSLATGHFLTTDSSRLSNGLFREVMRNIHDEIPTRPARPEGVFESGFELMSGTEIGQTCLPGSASGLNRTELFFVGYGPTVCLPSAFSTGLAAPTDFEVIPSGTTLNFSWVAGTGGAGQMTLPQYEAAARRANEMALATTHMTDALRNLSPTEGEARTMIRRIHAGGGGSGEVEFVVVATLIGGGTRELVSTSQTNASYQMSPSDINLISAFHVIARRGGNISDPSNSVDNVGLIDLLEFEIDIPDMEGRTLNEFHQWRTAHGIEEYAIFEAYSNTVEAGRIITTNPTGTMNVNQTITVIISLGEESENQTPTLPVHPSPPGESDTPESDIPEGDLENPFDEDELLGEVVPLMIFTHQPIAILPGRKEF